MTDAPLAWFDTHLRGETGLLPEQPVTIEVQGVGGEWRDLPDWPPPADRTHVVPACRRRARDRPPPARRGSERYRYDPADPTPSVGGIGMLTGGARDNAELEARDDVLVFTSDALTEPLEVVGPVSATVHLTSALDHFDVFVRVCDVSPDGVSSNVCDGLQRFTPDDFTRDADGVIEAEVELWPTALPLRRRPPRPRAGERAAPIPCTRATSAPASRSRPRPSCVANDVAVHHDAAHADPRDPAARTVRP